MADPMSFSPLYCGKSIPVFDLSGLRAMKYPPLASISLSVFCSFIVTSGLADKSAVVLELFVSLFRELSVKLMSSILRCTSSLGFLSFSGSVFTDAQVTVRFFGNNSVDSDSYSSSSLPALNSSSLSLSSDVFSDF